MRSILGVPASLGITAPQAVPVGPAITPTMGQIMARHAAYEARIAQTAGLVSQANAAARAAAQAAAQSVRNGLGAGGLDPISSGVNSAQSATGLNVWQGASAPSQIVNGSNYDVTINQTQSRALLSWNSFNIGRDTTLTFNQQGHSDWVVVNRVVGGINPATGLLDPALGPTPSQILGQMKADGTVYVLNRAGVMFGATAQVNLHSLLVSSLELGSATVPAAGGSIRALSLQERNNAFLEKGLLPETVSGLVSAVAGETHGDINVGQGARINAGGGYVIIAAPKASSAGEIKTSVGGQVSIQAGKQIDAYVSTGAAGSVDPNVRGLVLTSLGGGKVDVSGSIDAPQGYISLGTDLSGSVELSGILTSTTSVSRNGKISLIGGTVDVAPAAAISIRPDTGTETIPQSADSVAAFKTSQIEIGSHYYTSLNGRITGSDTGAISVTDLLPARITIGKDATIQAPSANVAIGGTTNGANHVVGEVPGLSDAGIVIQSNAVIDVSGIADYIVPATRNLLVIDPAKRNELRDTPNYRDTTTDGSFTLNGATLNVDPRISGVRSDGVTWIGSPLLEAASLAGQIGVTAQELMTRGGNVTLATLGLVQPPAPGSAVPQITLAGSAIIDFSGGWVRYQEGTLQYSRLVTADGRIVDISQADPNEQYVAVGNGFIESFPQLADSVVYANPLLMASTYSPAYVEGRDAGSLTIRTPTGAVNAEYHGDAVAGARQIGDARAASAQSTLAGDVRKLQAVNGELPSGGLVHIQSIPGGDIRVGSADAEAAAGTMQIDDGMIAAAGLSALSLQTMGSVSFVPGSEIVLAAGGALNVEAGRTITFDGSISVPSGRITGRTYGVQLGSLFRDDDDVPADSVLKTAEVPSLFDIVVNPGATLSARGLWTNDSLVSDGNYAGSAYTSGGSINFAVAPHVAAYDVTGTRAVDLSGSIRLKAGSLLDVSGGGYVSPTGTLSLSGKGGNVSLVNQTAYFQLESFSNTSGGLLAANELFRSDLTTFQLTRDINHQSAVVPDTINAVVDIDGEIRSFGFKGGGTFTLVTPDLSFGSSGGTGTAIPLDFLDQTGFATLDLTTWKTALLDNVFDNGIVGKTALLATEQVTINAGETLNLTQTVLPSLLSDDQINIVRSLASGADISRVDALTPTNDLGDYDNLAANLVLGGLTELDLLGGIITGAAGATLTVSKLYSDGIIRIAGGSITQRQILPYSYVGPRAAIGVHQLLDEDGIDRGAGLSAVFGPADANGKYAETGALRDLLSLSGEDRQIYYLGRLEANQGLYFSSDSTTDLSGTSLRNPRAAQRSDGSLVAAGRLIAGGTITAMDLYAEGANKALFGSRGFSDLYYSNAAGLFSPSSARPALRIDAGAGAAIDLSGASDNYDVQLDSTTLAPMDVWSDAGRLSALGGGDVAGAIIDAHGGSEHAQGGTLEWRDPILSQSGGEGTLSADQIMSAGFDSFVARGRLSTAGDVDLALARSFLLRAPDFSGLPLSTLGNSSGDTKPFADPYYAISIGATGDLSITAPHIGLLGIDQVIDTLDDTGSGTLALHGSWIDVAGAVAFRNSLQTVTLDSQRDIRLIGVQSLARTLTAQTALDAPSLSGQLVAGGDLILRAAQVYATTGSGNLQRLVESNGAETVRPYLIASAGADATIRIERATEQTPTIPYSAGSYLAIRAPHIEQAGVLLAPLGRIDLGASEVTTQGNAQGSSTSFGATQSLTLAPGSVTSVSAAGMNIPYGTTTDLTEYYFSPTVSAPLTAPPAAELRLAGGDIAVQAGATVDASGGGDVYAYEFVAGTGGSRDVLSRFNSDSFSTRNGYQYPDGRQVYAIVPSDSAGLSALYDPLYSGDYGSLYGSDVGKTVHLEGAPGIAAGEYVLLPAQYAMLPGAMRLVENVGTAAPLPGGSATLLDGSIIVGGVYGVAGSDIYQSQRRSFTVQSQAVFRKYSRIELSSATKKFTDLAQHDDRVLPRMPADAARIVINPLKTLAIGDRFDTDTGTGGRGSEVDIAATLVDIVAPDVTPRDGYVTLTTSDLANLNAQSLFVGGIRTDNADGSTNLKISAHEINILNDSANPLTAPEILLAVDGLKSTLNVADGASIVATGTLADTRSGDYHVAAYSVDSGGNIVSDNSGAGAVLRLANGTERLVDRTGVLADDATLESVTFHIGAATLSGDALAFDTSRNMTVDTGARINARNIAVSSDSVSFSSRTFGVAGLVISPELEQVLGQAERLTVRANSTIGFTPGVHSFNDLRFDAAGVRLIRPGSEAPTTPLDVTIVADNLMLGNHGADLGSCKTAGQLACGTAGNSLTFNSQNFYFGSGTFRTFGFDAAVALTAASGAYYQGKGIFDVGAANLSLTTPFLIDLGKDGVPKTSAVQPDLEIRSSGTIAIAAPEGAATGAPTTPAAPGARLVIGAIGAPASNVTIDGTLLRATAGRIDVNADGDVELTGTAQLATPGYARDFGDAADKVRVTAPGGTVSLVSLNGDIAVGADAVLAIGGLSGTAGDLELIASDGLITLDGTIDAAAPGGGGDLVYDSGAGSLDLSSFFARYGADFTGDVEIRTGLGDLVVDEGQTLRLGSLHLTADGGTTDIAGKIDTSGVNGGDITLEGRDGVDLASTAILDAHALGYADSDTRQAKAGDVLLGVGTGGAIRVEDGATINLSATRAGNRLVSKTQTDPRTLNQVTSYTFVEADQGGTLTLKAPVIDGLNGETVDISFAGQVAGARDVTVEGYRSYDLANVAADSRFVGVTVDGDTDTAVLDLSAAATGKANFLADKATGTIVDFIRNFDISGARSELGDLVGLDVYHERPGVDLSYQGNIALASNWNLGAGTVDVAGAVAAGVMRVSPLGPRSDGTPRYEVVPGREAELFQNFVDLIYRVGGRVDGAAGMLTLRAGRNLDIAHSITDGFFTFGDQTDPDYINYQLGGGQRTFNPAISIQCGVSGANPSFCADVTPFSIDTIRPITLPAARDSVNINLTGLLRGDEQLPVEAAPYSAAANSAAATGLQADGAGDPLGSAQLFPLLADGRPVESFSIQLVGGAGTTTSVDALHIDRASGGSVAVEGETTYSIAHTKPTGRYDGALQLLYRVSGNADGSVAVGSNYFDQLVSLTDLDADTLSGRMARVQIGNGSDTAEAFMRNAAIAFFAAHPEEVQFFGPAGAPNAFTAPLGLVIQFLTATDASGQTLMQRFGAKVADGSFGYAQPTPFKAYDPVNETIHVGTVVRTGTGSIDIAAAGNIDLRNGDIAQLRNANGRNALSFVSNAAQVGGSAVYTAGHVVVPQAVSARVAGTTTNLVIDPTAYVLNADLRSKFWLPDVAGRLQFNPVYATGGGSISLVAGQDVLGRRDVWSEAFNANNEAAVEIGGIDRRSSTAGMIGAGDQRWRAGSIGVAADGSSELDANIRINPNMFRSGVATFGGGDIDVTAGRDVRELTVALDTSVTTGDVGGGFGQMIYGGGNLGVTAGRDIAGGRYDISTGIAHFSAGADIGSSGDLVLRPEPNRKVSDIRVPNRPEIRVTDTAVTLSAGGSIDIGSVSALGIDSVDGVNGTIDHQIDQNALGYYSGNSGITLTAGGDVALGGVATSFYRLNGLNLGSYSGAVLPGTLDVTSLTGNIDLGRLPMMLYPSASGQLSLVAAGTVAPTTIDLDDGDASLMPGIFSAARYASADRLILSGRPFSLPVTLPTTSDAIRRLYHNPVPLHAGDTTPARIAVGGDLVDMTLFLAKQGRISAGGDIVNMMFNGQNVAAGDVTRIVAARDIMATTTGATYSPDVFGRALVQGNQFIIGGPGALYLEAGRDLGPFLNSAIVPVRDPLTDKLIAVATFPGGVLSVGNDFNPWLDPKSADIYAFFGVAKGMDFDALREAYLNPANIDALDGDLFEQVTDPNGNKTPDRTKPIYAPILIAWMQQNHADALIAAYGTADVTPAQAYAAFAALPELTQRSFLLDKLYFNELAAPSRSDGPSFQQYVRGYRAINTLFPASLGYTENDLTGASNGGSRISTGNLDLRLAAIETTRGSNVTILGPGGDAVLGSVVRTSAQAARRAYQTSLLEGYDAGAQGFRPNGTTFAMPVTGIPIGYEGVLTLRGGTIHGFTDGDLRLNQSRLFSQQSGDIILWSSNGDLNAGQGPKSAANVPPIVTRTTPDGFSEVDSAGAVTGAGIAGFAGIRRRDPVTGEFILVDALNDSDVVAAEAQLGAFGPNAEVQVNGKTYRRDLPTITLVAPAGTVDAGDAGVRAAGDIFVAAAQVSNSDNFKVGGSSVGVPSLSVAPSPALPSNAASAVTANMFRANQSSGLSDQPSRIQVEVLGYYSSGSSDCRLPDGSNDPNCTK